MTAGSPARPTRFVQESLLTLTSYLDDFAIVMLFVSAQTTRLAVTAAETLSLINLTINLSGSSIKGLNQLDCH